TAPTSIARSAPLPRVACLRMTGAMGNRALDAEIAERVFGWKPCRVPADARGENECEVLTRDGRPPSGGFTWPPRGRLHRGLLCPRFSSQLSDALYLANWVGLTFDHGRIPTDPEVIAKQALHLFYWRRAMTDEERIERAVSDIR